MLKKRHFGKSGCADLMGRTKVLHNLCIWLFTLENYAYMVKYTWFSIQAGYLLMLIMFPFNVQSHRAKIYVIVGWMAPVPILVSFVSFVYLFLLFIHVYQLFINMKYRTKNYSDAPDFCWQNPLLSQTTQLEYSPFQAQTDFTAVPIVVYCYISVMINVIIFIVLSYQLCTNQLHTRVGKIPESNLVVTIRLIKGQ